ncbi:MAG: hypothetical protein ABH844_01105 [Candidatus Omnitrophota bacterium]
MSKISLLISVLIAVAIVVAAFFVPWVRIDTSLGRVSGGLVDSAGSVVEKILPGSEKITGALGKLTDTVFGFTGMEFNLVVRGKDIPRMVNSKSSKVALAFTSILSKDTGSLNRKSCLVYLPMLLAIMCGLLAVLGVENKIYIIAMTIISGLISGAGLYRLNTIDFSNLVVNIEILCGVWLTLYSFLFISMVGLFWIFVYKERRWRIRW